MLLFFEDSKRMVISKRMIERGTFSKEKSTRGKEDDFERLIDRKDKLYTQQSRLLCMTFRQRERDLGRSISGTNRRSRNALTSPQKAS